eukprot:338916_1
MPTFIVEKMKAIEVYSKFEKDRKEKEKVKAQEKAAEMQEQSMEDIAEEVVENSVEDKAEKDVEVSPDEDQDAKKEENIPPPVPPPVVVITSADRSKALAQARLLLSETVTTLSDVCKVESKTEKSYKNVQVETSPSQKIWKAEEKGKRNYGISAKYEGTIEQNDDFLNFLESRRKAEEERMSRPKPQPGGGPILDTSIGVDDKTGNGDDGPISAIVQHLLEKKAAKRRAKSTKAAEKKKKASKKKAEKKKAGGNKNEGDKTASARSGKKKRNKKKSSKKDSSAKKAASAPKMLLKKS